MEKKKRYWLRGGLFLSIIVLFIGYLLWFTGLAKSMVIFAVIQRVISLPVLLLFIFGTGFPVVSSSQAMYFGLVFSAIVYFIIGAIFGLLYGKIKNRKKLQALSPKP